MSDDDNRISPSLFALKRVANLPRESIENLKAKILSRYEEILAEEKPDKSASSEDK